MALTRNKQKFNRRNPLSTFELLESRRVLATIAGTVYEDVNANEVMDDAEPTIPGVVIYLDSNRNGQLDQRGFGFDPDEFPEGAVLNNSRQSVFPSGTGLDNEPAFRVRSARSPSGASTGDLVFGQNDSAIWGTDRRLRFDFTLMVDSVALDAIGSSASGEVDIRLDAYDVDDQLLSSDEVGGLANGEARRLSIERGQKDISYVVARVSSARGAATFDNLLADSAGSERSTITGDNGFYRFIDEAAGAMTIAQQVPEGYTQTTPDGPFEIMVAGEAISGLDFGNRTSAVSGVAFNDVGLIGTYEPSLDELLPGSAVYLDVNRDGSPGQDDLMVDPDVFLPDQVLDFVTTGITLVTVDLDNNPTGVDVTASSDGVVSQDGQLFAREGDTAWPADERLRVDFDSPASTVELEFVAASAEGPERGIIIAYSHAGVEIDSAMTELLAQGQRQTMSINRTSFDIAYVVAYTVESPTEEGRLDNLSATVVAEPVAITNDQGEYLFKPLAAGDYRVGALPGGNQDQTFPEESDFYDVGVELGEEAMEINFGFEFDNLPPEAEPDSVSILEDQPIAIGVLINDTDPDGVLNEGSLSITQSPIHGTAEVTEVGFINYTPDKDFVGTDSLIYTVRDEQGALSNSALVTITITPVNDAPRAADDEVSVIQLTPTIINALVNDTDVDSSINATSLRIVTAPANGNAVVDGNSGNITYTPTEIGGDTFTYTVEDEEGAVSNTATVTILGLATGTPPVAVDDTFTIPEGTPREFDILANDTDADGIDPDSIAIITRPAQGTVTIDAGMVLYQPELGFVGNDMFSYQVRDNMGISSNTATVAVNMTERDFPYQNPINALDTNADGFVIPRDALIIINEVNNRRVSDSTTGAITVAVDVGERPGSYFDVNGDGFIVANDVLRIINFINSRAAAAAAAAADADGADGEGAAEPGDLQAAAVAAAFAQTKFDASDDEEEEA